MYTHTHTQTHSYTPEQWKGPLATQPERENDPSQTNRGVRGGCVGVVPRAQSKLSFALHAHRGKKLLQDLQNLDNQRDGEFLFGHDPIGARYDSNSPFTRSTRATFYESVAERFRAKTSYNRGCGYYTRHVLTGRRKSQRAFILPPQFCPPFSS